jgi:hypothetical protein
MAYDTDMIPEQWREEIDRFINYGEPPSDLVKAICNNDLKTAMKLVYDNGEISQYEGAKLITLTAWLWTKAPCGCLHDPTRPERGPDLWVKLGGTKGTTPDHIWKRDEAEYTAMRNIFGEPHTFKETVNRFYNADV